MSRHYCAAPVPRFLRQSRLSYLPMQCVIGCHPASRANGMMYDVIMLPAQHFQRMKTYVALQHIIAPLPAGGPGARDVYLVTDIKSIVVADDEPNPEQFAKNHFIKEFGLVSGAVPQANETDHDEDLSPIDMAELEESFRRMINSRDKK